MKNVFVVVAVSGVLLWPTRARADLWGADLGPLTSLVSQSAVQISQFAEAIQTASEIYEETKKYVGMAQDAVDTFQSVASWGQQVLQRPDQALDSMFPDMARIRNEIASPETWRQGTGELQRRMQVCLSGSNQCGQFYERITGQQAQQAISDTYGTAPIGRNDIMATDSEAAAAMVESSVQVGRAAVSQEKYDALLGKCTEGDVTSCQAAANMASILEAKGIADLNTQMATSNRLHATQLAVEASREKREALEAQQRSKAVLDGWDDLGKATIMPKTAPTAQGEVP